MPLDPKQILQTLSNTAGVDTSFPLLPKGNYTLVLTKMELVVSEKTKEPPIVVPGVGSGHMIVAHWALKTPAKDVLGKPVHAGFPFKEYIMLVPSGKLELDAIQRSVATFVRGVLGRDGNIFQFKDFLNKEALRVVDVRLKRTDPKTGIEYPDSNTLKGFILPDKK